MHQYVIMRNPGQNRVYYKQSIQLSIAELGIACADFQIECGKIELMSIAGIDYLSFECSEQLSDNELDIISRLSFAFALFELKEEQGKKLLLPIKKSDYEYVDPKISSILKYSGKTNRLFTRMMINIAILSSNFSYEDSIKLLDPVVGKGTTLFEGLIYGFDVSGIEIGKNPVKDTCLYLKKYLETDKYKHSYVKGRIPNKDKTKEAFRHHFEFALNKEDYKSNKNRDVNIVVGNCIYADEYFKNKSFHIIVGDLPYGITHGNKAKNQNETITRNPVELLKASLPSWHRVLKTGGVVVLAWNTFVVSHERMTAVFEENGFTVFKENYYSQFEHRVDNSIKRDIIIARK